MQSLFWHRPGFEPGTSWSTVQHSTTMLFPPCVCADILSKFSGMLDALRKFGDVLIKAFNKVKQVFMVVCESRRYLLTYWRQRGRE